MNNPVGECADCGRSLDHCHGTLAVHGDGTLECTDDTCALLDPLRHTPIVDCETLTGGCCGDESQQALARAS
jgi:hypothetical protein